MKAYLIVIVLLLFAFSMKAQTYITGNPPLVEWTKTDIWPIYPPIYSSLLPGGLPAEKSGEDWFYDVQKKKDLSTGLVNGYIMTGYSTLPEFNSNVYPDNSFNNWSCGAPSGIGDGCDDLRRYDVSNPQYDIIAGDVLSLFAITDLNGNFDPVNDFKLIPVKGALRKSIQNSDGSYVAIGICLQPNSFNISGGQITGLTLIHYNPGYSQTDHFIDCGDYPSGGNYYGIKGYVTKLNSDLSVAWTYMYGLPKEADAGALGNSDVLGFAPCTGGFVLAGYDHAIGTPSQKAMLIKIDNNGQILPTWPKEITAMQIITSIERTVEAGQEFFYVCGNKTDVDTKAVIAKLDTDGNVIWQTPIAMTGTFNITDNLTISTSGDVFVTTRSGSVVAPCNLYKLAKTDGTILNSHLEGSLNFVAQDLQYKVVATSDGGCAVSATVLRYPINWDISAMPLNYPSGITTPSCFPQTWRWNTDAYVAKFSSSLVKMWSTSFDANTLTPGGSALDILSQCSNASNGACPLSSWQIPNQQGLDVSRQECIFDIEEAPDGGLIIVGKNSRNIDDCYIAKLCGSGSPLTLNNQTISDKRGYDHYSIKVSNSTFTSTSNVKMESCRYILFEPKTSVESNSVLTASIDPNGCCSSIYSGGAGLRKGETSTEPIYATQEQNWITESSVFPNPNTGNFQFTMETNLNEKLTIEIFNPMGRAVYFREGVQSSGNTFSTEINLGTNRISGIYLLKVYSKNKVHTKKVIVQ